MRWLDCSDLSDFLDEWWGPGLTGYDLPIIRAMAQACSAEIVASGGAGRMEHFYEAAEAGATVLLAASVFDFHTIDIPDLKAYLRGRGVIMK